jgi:uncharacterized membrane protein
MLRTSYWKAFLVSIILAIIGGNGGPSFSYRSNFGGGNPRYFDNFFTTPGSDVFWPFFVIILIVTIIVVVLVVFALCIFLGYPLEVGGRRYFIHSAQNNVDLNFLGYSFEKTRYMDIIKAMLWRAVINFLWFLLLIIPGIVKAYAFRMVPYILADNPNIGYKHALKLSEKMTDGHKFNMFVLDLSFIGWYLLGILALFIGIFFVLPYVNATQAELYLVLRKNALALGLCSHDELLLEQI